MDGRELRCIEAEKDLGVFVDKELNFDQHILINETVKLKEANQIAIMITHYIQYKNKEIMVLLFKSLVQPILE